MLGKEENKTILQKICWPH